MQRYFLNQTLDTNQFELVKDSDTYQHFGRVLRAKVGSQAEFVDQQQRLVIAKVDSIDSEKMTLTIVKELNQQVELSVAVTLVVSPLKNDRSDWLVQKATELGVSRIVFTSMARSVVNWEKQAAKKQARLEKIALAAAQQSHRLVVPKIDLLKLEQTFQIKSDIALVAWEESAKEGEASRFVQEVSTLKSGQSLCLWFGPEGGLSSDEIKQLSQADYKPVGLGPRILRAETAPIYALSGISVLTELQ
ncbi:RsmE family RNA methyltransferase [Convivina praedatoris]|uniref:Ribosomal RNA small subunit methyltransferase E n=1 Tax=Convivina praedatoris TaxID=2880963 RepID=A0ABN8HD32_9LACO|nr:RsmE family RNA methyltransferase [Convivina sp. LMG 32447]CAH1852133.1 Ribosomal RNA small subunit methyltransferase E [Convivina sp. LMG 32447]CAH1853814.1 Ribosomal RNA small subunit methyltransferase E [Convivina sp. LMG 32447]CAH1854272.1 Ribosomal RNA small subunit methyltransferase E [Convivina sp. LMG 32447]